MKNAELTEVNLRHAKKIIKQSSADGSCLYLSFKNRSLKQPDFLFRSGAITPRLGSDFTRDIFRHDPHLSKAAAQISSTSHFYDNHYFKEALIEEASPSLKQYWHFMLTGGIKETATYIQPITSNIMLVIGLASSNEKVRIKLQDTLPLLASWAQESQEILSDMAFQTAFFTSDTVSQPVEGLSAREQQVVVWLKQGYSNKEIAHHLSLSVFTIENYLRRIYKKFDVHNRTALCSKLFEH